MSDDSKKKENFIYREREREKKKKEKDDFVLNSLLITIFHVFFIRK